MSLDAKPRPSRRTGTTLKPSGSDAPALHNPDAVSAPINLDTSAAHVGKSASVPAFPFAWFRDSIAELKKKGVLPRKIDRSVWGNKLFPLTTRDLATTFQFLTLADEDRNPSPRLEQLVLAFGTEEWPTCLSQILRTAYAPVWAMDTDRTSAGQLFQEFGKLYGVNAETARKSVAFFLHATREARISEGAFLVSTRRGPRATRKTENPKRDAIAESMLEMLPPFDTTWNNDVKLAWLAAFTQLIDRI